jgi:hypothetical protein
MGKFYKNLEKAKSSLTLAGGGLFGGGAKASWIMPPDPANTKVGHQVYEVLDLVCEGPIAGPVKRDGTLTETSRTLKDYSESENAVGSSTNGIDHAIFFNDVALRENGQALANQYDCAYLAGEEFQNPPEILPQPKRLRQVSSRIQGAYVEGGDARKGTGSNDIRYYNTRDESIPRKLSDEGRDFVSWQNYIPVAKDPLTFSHQVGDPEINSLDIHITINQLYDTRSFATKKENKHGKSKMGTQIETFVEFQLLVNGSPSSSAIIEAGKGITISTTTGKFKVQGVIASAYGLSIKSIQLPHIEDGQQNNVTLEVLTPHTISNLIKREIQVTGVTETHQRKYSYPGSVLFGTRIDARFYPSVPARTFRLKGKIVKVPSNYFAFAGNMKDMRFPGQVIYEGNWDGTFKWGYTDNPVWILYDLCTNQNYGLGGWLRNDKILNIWELYKIAKYADAVDEDGAFVGVPNGNGGVEPRFTCNAIISDQKNAPEVLREIASVFRGMVYYKDSQMHIVADMPTVSHSVKATSPADQENLALPPQFIFNNQNVRDGIFSYSDVDKSSKVSVMEGNFLDRGKNYAPATVIAEDSETIKRIGISTKSVDLFGTTSKSQAQRMVNYLLYQALYETEIVSFDAGYEALLLRPGDIIRVDDEAKNLTKSFGTIMGTSGSIKYFTPYSENYVLGPEYLIVDPGLGDLSFDSIGDLNTITIYSPLSQDQLLQEYDKLESDSGVADSAQPSIHQPQVIQLTLAEDAPIQCESGYLLKLHETTEFQESGQWFAGNGEIDLIQDGYYDTVPSRAFDITAGDMYTIDVSGRKPSFYKTTQITEAKDGMFSVTAVSHFLEKFKYIEEGVEFDKKGFDEDFDFNPLSSSISKPNIPAHVSTGIFSSGTYGETNLIDLDTLGLQMPIFIYEDSPNQTDRYKIIVQYPSLKISEKTISKGTFISESEYPNGVDPVSTGSLLVASTVLKGKQSLTEQGTYKISVYGVYDNPFYTESSGSFAINLPISLDDFGLYAQSSYYKFSDIVLNSPFENTFDEFSTTGSGYYPLSTPNIAVMGKIDYDDMFSRGPAEVNSEIDEFRIDIRDLEGNLVKENIIARSGVADYSYFAITPYDLDAPDAFNYSGDGVYDIPKGIEVEVKTGDISSSNKTESFEVDIEYYPCTFSQHALTSVGRSDNWWNSNIYKEYGINWASVYKDKNTNTSVVYDFPSNREPQLFQFVRSPAENSYSKGSQNFFDQVYSVGAPRKNLVFGNAFISDIDTTGADGSYNILFRNNFDSPPIVVSQVAKDFERQGYQTILTDISVSGFNFKLMHPRYGVTGLPGGSNTKFEWIAAERGEFNWRTGSPYPEKSLNFAATGIADFNLSGEFLPSFVSESDPSSKWPRGDVNYLIQKSGDVEYWRDKTVSVYPSQDSAGNRLAINYTDSRVYSRSGMAVSAGEESNIYLPKTGNLFGPSDDFALAGWFRFNSTLTGKQYLCASSYGSTGFGWFQSGDGQNYLHVNGSDYQMTSGESLNDDRVHRLFIKVDRDTSAKVWVDHTQTETNPVSITGFNGADLNIPTGIELLGSAGLTGGSLVDGKAVESMGLIRDINTPSDSDVGKSTAAWWSKPWYFADDAAWRAWYLNSDRSFVVSFRHFEDISAGVAGVGVSARDPFILPANRSSYVLFGFSLRRIHDNYYGPLVELVRGSDGAAANVYPNDDNVLGLDSEILVTSGSATGETLQDFILSDENAVVKTWWDQRETTQNNLYQYDTGRAPWLISGGSIIEENSRPALFFETDGSKYLDFTSGVSNVRSVVYVCTPYDTTTSNRSPIFGYNNDYDYYAGSAGNWLDSSFNNPDITGGSNRINASGVDLTTTQRTNEQTLLSMVHLSASGQVNSLSKRSSFESTSSWRGAIQEIIATSVDSSSYMEEIEEEVNLFYNIYGSTGVGTYRPTGSFNRGLILGERFDHGLSPITVDDGSVSGSFNVIMIGDPRL